MPRQWTNNASTQGLGKTLQTISFLGYLKHVRGVKGPHLVVVPKSTLHNWLNEFNKWVPDFDAFVFHGDKEARVSTSRRVPIVSYMRAKPIALPIRAK